MIPLGMPDRRRHALTAAAIAAVITIGPAVALIVTGHNAGRAAWDSIVYHEPFIRQLAADWPRFDLSNPLTATTPAYHVLLASAVAAGLESTPALRMLSTLIGAALVALVAGWCARRAGPRDAVLLTLPLACSLYVVSSTAWLLPDNLAWIGVALLLILALHPPERPGPARRLVDPPAAAAAAVLLVLVLTRQIHLWAAGLVWLAAWFNAHPAGTPAFARIPSRIPRVLAAVVLTLPAFFAVAWFARHWGGLTPPRFQSDISGVNPATPAFILVQIAVLCVGFGPWLLPGLLQTVRHRPALVAAAGGIGLALAVIPATTFDPDAGRYSGWWSLARATPAIFGHTSPAFLLLAPLGAVLLAGPLAAAPRRTGWVLLGALIAFAAAQSATINSWQRYHEPFLIIFLAMLAASQPNDLRTGPFRRLRIPAMGILALLLALVTARELRGDPVAPGTTPPAKHTSPGDPWAAPAADPAEQPSPAAEPA